MGFSLRCTVQLLPADVSDLGTGSTITPRITGTRRGDNLRQNRNRKALVFPL